MARIGGPLSEYERERLERIKRNKAILDSVFPDLESTKRKLSKPQSEQPPQKRKRRTYKKRKIVRETLEDAPKIVRRNPSRSVRGSSTPVPEGVEIAVRESGGHEDFFERNVQISGSTRWTKPLRSVEIEFDDHKTWFESASKPAECVMDKIYSSNGTTCHQCRQKTLDGKTRCKNVHCLSKRGQFCGVCLKNRYGELVLDALRDKRWLCPPCRGICNCSVCFTRRGRAPTGILKPTAEENGFSCVKDYLESVEEKNKKMGIIGHQLIEFCEDEEEEEEGMIKKEEEEEGPEVKVEHGVKLETEQVEPAVKVKEEQLDQDENADPNVMSLMTPLEQFLSTAIKQEAGA